MQQFIGKFRERIQATLSGFDRLVFRGSPRRLNIGWRDPNQNAFIARGMEEYLWQRKILFKDYSEPVKQVSERLKRDALRPFQLRGRKPGVRHESGS